VPLAQVVRIAPPKRLGILSPPFLNLRIPSGDPKVRRPGQQEPYGGRGSKGKPEGDGMATTRHPGGARRTLERCLLGQRIEQLTDARGFHLDEVAAAAGITYPTLHRICTGRIKSPKLETIKAVAEVLGVKIDRLTK
jgi:DNA-binding Xre family transcriptional regulator